jgi:single-stranded DNA-binding protein
MNKCHFLGKFLSDPKIEPSHNTSVTRFDLEVQEFRKDKNGAKKRRKDILRFEAWDTAATAITKQAEKNDLMVVECIARNGYDSSDVVFRVTNFKVFKSDYFDDEK